MTRFTIFLFTAIAISSCSHYPADVERALKLAGENRPELEKVLEHYSQQPQDKLKLQSAYFLIANMPYHYTVKDTRLDAFKETISEIEKDDLTLANYEKTYGRATGQMEIQPDLHYITSEFLIRNIDFSFQVWQEAPWSKYFSFDVFCEEILPYRLSHEPLEHWKEEYYARFRPLIDTMTNHLQPDEVCMKLLDIITDQGWTWEFDLSTQGFGATFILREQYGSCKEQTEYIAYILRSLGIPSGIDLKIVHPDHFYQTHYLNFTRNIAGKSIGFDYFVIVEPVVGNVRRTRKKYGKIYRQCHALQQESAPVKYKDTYIPQGGLRNILLKDVSAEYFPDTHISVRLEPLGSFGKNDLAFLCVFNNIEWVPLSCTKQKKGLAEFGNVESNNILYQVWFFDKTQSVALSKPFVMHENGEVQFFDADMNALQSMTLLRKFRLPAVWSAWIHRAINGKFQGANQPDFSDAVTLHTIEKDADFSFEVVRTEHPGKFRYVRYLSADGGYNNMAEIKFYSGGKVLSGEVVGTDGAREKFPNSTKYAVFDDDPLTFFDALEANGAWVGLRLNQACQIDSIRYIFRNDDNNIRPGDTYELFYNSNKEWYSAGAQTAVTTQLTFDHVPSNTLYWLRDRTRGKEERPFTYENGQQVWW